MSNFGKAGTGPPAPGGLCPPRRASMIAPHVNTPKARRAASSSAPLRPAVVVVGSFVQDLTWRCAAFPKAGETVIGRFVTGPGGKGSNQAVACARAGARTRFVGAVGTDAFAAAARDFYAAEGIDAAFVPKPGEPTATAGILVEDSGQNEIVVALGASARIRPSDVPASLLRGARVVVCQHEATLAVNARAFRLARRAGATTVLNPAPMRPDFDPAILDLTDVLIPNEPEFAGLARRLPACRRRARALVGRRPLDEGDLRRLGPPGIHRLARSIGVPVVIVTLGERGCLVSREGGFSLLPACAGVRVVDTTGAGDAFVGGFAAGLVRFSGDVLAAARFANAAAALSVTRPGTAPSMPRLPEIERLLRRLGQGGRGMRLPSTPPQGPRAWGTP